MKITQKQYNPIQIVLETPEEVQAVLLVLNKYAQTGLNPELRKFADTMYNEMAKHLQHWNYVGKKYD